MTPKASLPAPNDSFTLGEGEFRDFFTTGGFTVTTTDGYLHVAQFLVVQSDCTPWIGDSALLYVPAVDQRRGYYLFTTGKGFSSNHAIISMPVGTTTSIDGADVTAVCDGPRVDGQLDGIDYESWDCDISDGVHEVYSGSSPEETSVPVGVYVYGYYSAGSYAYPAGSDLRQINPAIPE